LSSTAQWRSRASAVHEQRQLSGDQLDRGCHHVLQQEFTGGGFFLACEPAGTCIWAAAQALSPLGAFVTMDLKKMASFLAPSVVRFWRAIPFHLVPL
jgi:hypothetical protein